jgi:prenyltransferase beta subunit
MTIRLDMRRAVTKGGEALGDSVETVRGFLRRQLAEDGGFRGREDRSDLYYTVFGLEASLTLGVDIPHDRVSRYLTRVEAGESLDFVHLTSLIRSCANVSDSWGDEMDGDTRWRMIKHLLEYRSRDGGFSTVAGAARGNVYGGFLALGACQDLGLDAVDIRRVAESIRSLQMPDGGYSNEPAMTVSATPATAAAVCVFHYLKQSVPASAVRWLLDRAHPLGGFTAIPFAADCAVPDLLSTATAVHALSLIGAWAGEGKDKHLDYLDSLWSTQGGFRGHWGDETVDCEYTYYGLLSLGSLVE